MNKKRWILWILVALTVAFIFGQSLLDQDASNKESTAVKKHVVESLQEVVTGTDKIHISSSFLRDIAHMIEFAILGFEIVFC